MDVVRGLATVYHEFTETFLNFGGNRIPPFHVASAQVAD